MKKIQICALCMMLLATLSMVAEGSVEELRAAALNADKKLKANHFLIDDLWNKFTDEQRREIIAELKNARMAYRLEMSLI